MVQKHWGNSQREKEVGMKMNTDIIHRVLESLMNIGKGVCPAETQNLPPDCIQGKGLHCLSRDGHGQSLVGGNCSKAGSSTQKKTSSVSSCIEKGKKKKKVTFLVN